MRTRLTQGFTIIEVILVLAITGLLLAGILAVLSNNINQQRYNDSLRSFEDFLQSQYAAVDSTVNIRDNNYECTSTGINRLGTPGSENRGQATCTIVGRYITTENSGENLVSKPIFATVDVLDEDVQKAVDESAQIAAMDIVTAGTIYTEDDETFKLPWATNTYTDAADPENSKEFSMAIIRLPISGSIRTYITPTKESLANTISGSSTDLTVCVNPDGMVANPSGILVRIDATNASAVSFLGDEAAC